LSLFGVCATACTIVHAQPGAPTSASSEPVHAAVVTKPHGVAAPRRAAAGRARSPQRTAQCDPSTWLVDRSIPGETWFEQNPVFGANPKEYTPGLLVSYPNGFDDDGRHRDHWKFIDHDADFEWSGPVIPAKLPLELPGGHRLRRLEKTEFGYLALHVEQYDKRDYEHRKELQTDDVIVGGYDSCGRPLWQLAFADIARHDTLLRLDDVQYEDDVLYLNEACLSYAKDLGGKCSQLVAMDPRTGRERWRSPYLTSRHRFVVHGDYIVAGYGFTAEANDLHIVRKSDGKRVSRQKLPDIPMDLYLDAGGDLVVELYHGSQQRYRLGGWTSRSPKLVRR
jgi:hypothetical protein